MDGITNHLLEKLDKIIELLKPANGEQPKQNELSRQQTKYNLLVKIQRHLDKLDNNTDEYSCGKIIVLMMAREAIIEEFDKDNANKCFIEDYYTMDIDEMIGIFTENVNNQEYPRTVEHRLTPFDVKTILKHRDVIKAIWIEQDKEAENEAKNDKEKQNENSSND